MNNLERTAYHAELVAWLSRSPWDGFVTFTHKNHRPGDWFFARLHRLQNLLQSRYHVAMEWAASIEKTKAGVNHCHSLVRFSDKSAWLKPGSAVFPTDWVERQHAPVGRLPGVVNAIHKLCNSPLTTFELQNSRHGLDILRSNPLGLNQFVRMWYQGNYGCMADYQPIKSQAGVISYALKYAMKEVAQPHLTWMISKQAVPSLG